MTRHNGRPFDSRGPESFDVSEERLRGQLDVWRLSESPDDLEALAEVLARSAPRPRRSLRAVVSGVAAAV
ncbi:MAG: hypothetical protein AAGB93_03735, partial [Planctomycetota bacterium]